MLKMLYKVELSGETEAYLVSDGGVFLFYNLDGIYIATVPEEWRIVEKVGAVETGDDFERMTGRRPELFWEDCRICRQPALLLLEHDEGICVECRPEGGYEVTDYVN